MRWLLVVIMLAGCSAAPVDQATEPIYTGGFDQGYKDNPGIWYDCGNLTVPEIWYGHSTRDLWCVQEASGDFASGSIVSPANMLQSFFTAKNGSAGHPAGTPLLGNVYIACTGVCQADVTLHVESNETVVATLQSVRMITDDIVGNGVWITMQGQLDGEIPKGGLLHLHLEVTGAGGIMKRGHSGTWAPWIEIGA